LHQLSFILTQAERSVLVGIEDTLSGGLDGGDLGSSDAAVEEAMQKAMQDVAGMWSWKR
jgi:dihydroxyacetone kinase DhaKLM complex PTS-EIIA-like component DhaM